MPTSVLHKVILLRVLAVAMCRRRDFLPEVLAQQQKKQKNSRNVADVAGAALDRSSSRHVIGGQWSSFPVRVRHLPRMTFYHKINCYWW